MDTSIYMFMIFLDIFIVFFIFAIYIYVLFKYYLHSIEDNTIVKYFNIHLQFYKPIVKLIKEYSKNDKNTIINTLQNIIDNVIELPHSSFITGTIIIICSILVFFLMLLIYFAIYYEKIIPHIRISNLIYTIIINIILIVGVELMFAVFVYGGLDIINIQQILNL